MLIVSHDPADYFLGVIKERSLISAFLLPNLSASVDKSLIYSGSTVL